jgi:hypothetical protein
MNQLQDRWRRLLARFCENQEIEVHLVRKLKNLVAARRSLSEMAAR